MIESGLKIQDGEVLCPACGFEFVHVGVFGGPHVDAGGAIVIPAECERGHGFDICFWNHAGRTQVYCSTSDEGANRALREAMEEVIDTAGAVLAARVISRFTRYGTGSIGDVPAERRCEATVALRAAGRKAWDERLD